MPGCKAVRAADARRTITHRRWLSGAVSAAALTAAIPALAQTSQPVPETAESTAAAQANTAAPPAGAPPAEDAVDPNAVSEVIVTAQRREQRLQDVPITITVVNNQLLESTNARNLTELQGAVPSAFFHGNSGGGRTYVTLRGATGLALNTGDEPVAVYMDDIYLGRGVIIGQADILDVAAIEIVRGPQGTLQGRNATAGAILIRSANPTSTPEGRLFASIADPLEVRAQGVISGPITDTLNGRVAVGYVDERGWATQIPDGDRIGGGESYQGRIVLDWRPNDRFSGRFVADYANVTAEPAIIRYGATTFSTLPTGALVPAGTATPQIPLTRAQLNRIRNDHEFELSPGTDTTVETGGFTARLTYAFEGVDLISLSGYRGADVAGVNDSDGLAVARQGFNINRTDSRTFSQEVRLQSSGDTRFSWILGGYYYREDQEYDDIIYNLRFTLPINSGTEYVGTIDTRSFAVFADATYQITDRLSVIGGLRYTEDERSIDGLILATNLDTRVTTRTAYGPASTTWDDVSYRFKVTYEPTEDILLFAGYGRGFRGGGYNPFAVQPPYSPEINLSFEAGIKADFFERRLGLSLAYYDNDYKDLQLRAGVPTGGAIITNAAAADIRGVELEFTARPIDGLRLSGNMAYTDATFSSFPRARDLFDRPVDATGNRLPRTPEWSYFLAGAYDFGLQDGSIITAEANYRWRDDVVFFFTDQEIPTFRDDAAGELGARLSWRDAGRRWQVALFGTNLTDERIINTAAVTFSYPQVGFNKPRVIGVSVERQF